MSVESINPKLNGLIYNSSTAKTIGANLSGEDPKKSSKSVSFFSDDWSAYMARKLGMDDFADWIDNKEALENPENAAEENFLSKGLRTMVKHPVLTILSVAAIVSGGRYALKSLKNAQGTQVAEAVKVKEVVPITPNQALVQKPISLEPTPENVQKITEKVFSGIYHQSSIEFADFEALNKLSKAQKESLVTYLETYTERKPEFLSFLAGERPATLEGSVCCSINTFSGMRSDDLIVSAFFWDQKANLLMNKKAVKKIIATHKDFFQQRLGLPVGSTLEDIERLVFRSSGSPLAKKNVFEDLILLIQGHDKYNAIHAQIVKDIKKTKFLFHPCEVKDVDVYKALLKESVLSKRSTYYGMGQDFIDDVIKKIDTFPERSLRRIVAEPIEVFKTPQGERNKFQSLVRFAQDLEDAQLHGKPIQFG